MQGVVWRKINTLQRFKKLANTSSATGKQAVYVGVVTDDSSVTVVL